MHDLCIIIYIIYSQMDIYVLGVYTLVVFLTIY